MEIPAIFVGIDVAQARLDSAVRPSGEQWTSPRDDAGIAAPVSRLQALEPTLVVLEATGGRELPLASALAAARLPTAVVNPRQVRDSAKAVGQLAKTDALDAQVLARFAEAVRPEPRALPDAQAQEVAALLGRRRQLVGMLTAEQQAAAPFRAPPITALLNTHPPPRCAAVGTVGRPTVRSWCSSVGAGRAISCPIRCTGPVVDRNTEQNRIKWRAGEPNQLPVGDVSMLTGAATRAVHLAGTPHYGRPGPPMDVRARLSVGATPILQQPRALGQ